MTKLPKINKINEVSKNPKKALEEEYFSLSDIFLSLARQINIVIACTFLFSIFAIINVQFFTTPLFQSISKITSSSSPSSRTSGIAAQFGISLGSSNEEEKWIYTELIKSRKIAKLMLARTFDTKEFGVNKTLFHILTSGVLIEPKNREKMVSKSVDKFIGMISVSKDRESGIFTIGLTSEDPDLAYELNKALIEEIELHHNNTSKQKNNKTLHFILGRISDTAEELRIAEESLTDFRGRNRRIENSPSLLLEEDRLSREVLVLTSVFTTLKQQLETTKIEEFKEDEYIIIVDPPEKPFIKSYPIKRSYVIKYFFIGLVLGLIIAIAIEYLKRVDKNEKDRFLVAKNIALNNLWNIFNFDKK